MSDAMDLPRFESLSADWQAGRRKVAMEGLKDYLSQYPDDVTALMTGATWANHAGDIARADELFRAAAAVSPLSETLQHYCVWLFSHNRFEELREFADTGKNRFPEDFVFEAFMIVAGDVNEDRVDQLCQAISESLDGAALPMVRRLFLSTSIVPIGAKVLNAVQRRLDELYPEDVECRSQRAFLTTYRDDLTPEEVVEEQRGFGQLVEGALKPIEAPFRNNRNADRKLRIGYVSGDFRKHVVGNFLLGLLANHDKDEVETYLYIRNLPDVTTEAYMSSASFSRDIFGMSPVKVAERIRSDKIDILVDLSGHTGGSLTPMFAMRPAPVQVNYLGYPSTTGFSRIQYRLVDEVTDPIGSDHLASESLWRIPRCFLAYQPLTPVPEVSLDLPPSPTIGTFNNLRKVSHKALALWAKLQSAVPEATVILKFQTPMSDGMRVKVESQISESLQYLGGDPSRIKILPFLSTPEDNLRAYSMLDFALDTMPYNGTTTTLDALSMGIPVLALLGDDHRSRVSASLLKHGGFGDWVAETEDEYIEKAKDLISRRTELAANRAKVRRQFFESQLCDTDSHARAIEAAYRDMWRYWCDHPV